MPLEMILKLFKEWINEETRIQESLHFGKINETVLCKPRLLLISSFISETGKNSTD